MAAIREKEARQTETYRAEGIRGMMGEKGLKEEDWTDRSNWRRKDYIIAKWAQEGVETLYNLLNNNIK
jgi:hypothetical protein